MTPRLPAAAATLLLALLLLLLVTGCGASDDDVAAWRADIAARGAERIQKELLAEVTELGKSLERGKALLEQEGDPFEALDSLERESTIDGVLFKGEDGEDAWTGRPLAANVRRTPPWQGSFREGSISYHDGPFLRALVAGPIPAAGGSLSVTRVLESRLPGDMTRPFARRWLDRLNLDRVTITQPADVVASPEGTVRFLVEGPEGPALQVTVEAPATEAVEDLMADARQGWLGVGFLLLGLGLLVTSAILLSRGISRRPFRLLALAVLVLAARTLLVLVALPERWPVLRGAFDRTDFGVEDPLGWLASPGDLALSALAVLVAATLALLAVKGLRPPRRLLLRASAVVFGTALAGWVGALFVRLVELVVAESQTPFFDVASFVPPLASTLLLVGLLMTTAAAWLLVSAFVWLAALGLRGRRLPWRVLVPTLVATAVALVLAPSGPPLWMTALLPLASLLAQVRPGNEAVSTLSSAAVLVGVLATFLLFPVLWNRLLEHRSEMLLAALDDLVQREAEVESAIEYELEAIAEDEAVRLALRQAADGPRPEGIAFHLWLLSFLAEPGEHGLVSVFDREGRRLDEFTLTPLPRRRMPAPAPPATGAGDLQLVNPPGEGRRLRAAVGRVRIRDDDGEPLGSVVLTVPEPVDLTLYGLRTFGGATGDAPYRIGVRPFDLSYAVLHRGAVVRSNDSSIPLGSRTFGPPALTDVGPEKETYDWQTADAEGRAVWSARRSGVIAVRRRTPTPADTVLGLARLVTLGVGLALVIATVALLTRVRRVRPRLQHRLLLSYFAISFLPIVLLGLATAREIRLRHDAELEERLTTDVRRARSDLEDLGASLFDQATDNHLVKWASEGRPDLFLYREGRLIATSRAGLVEAEVLPAQLPADAYQATVRERRELVGKESTLAGQSVWFAYAPILDDQGRVLATVGIPRLQDRDRVAEELAVTGNVLVAAYLFALVLVLVGGLWAARRLTSPLRLLAAGTRRVTAGELDVELRPEGRDELGELVAAFNVMTGALRSATERAAKAERESAWRRMARQVAHEIKNPLTPIRLMIQQMEAEALRDPERAPEAIRQTAPVVLRQIEALGKIARDFAHFARMPQRDLREVDVGPLARDVVDLHAGSAQEGVRVRGEIADGLPTVRWDESELRRVLLNVVGNAVQAVEGEGRVDVRAVSETRGRRRGVAITVRDTGVGIPPEDLERVFEPDFSTKTSGTGLGLAMVRRAMVDMGGRVRIESEPGEGTTFHLWWPA